MKDILPKFIQEDKPDVILIGGEYFAHGIGKLARCLAIPTILSATGPFSAFFHKILSKDMGHDLLADARQVDLVIACASQMARDLLATGMRNIETIQNSVDTDKFSDGAHDDGLFRELDIRHNVIVVLDVSNLTPPKRVLDLVGAARLALEHEPRLVFVIVGDGPCSVELEEVCTRDGIVGRFRFVGWIDHGRVPDFIRLSHVIVMLSETEGLALASLEAQAHARLILASDIPGAREVIVHAETGLLFRMGDVHELAEKILLAASDRDLRTRIGAKAQAFVRESHSLDAAVVKYENVFERLIGRTHVRDISFSGI